MLFFHCAYDLEKPKIVLHVPNLIRALGNGEIHVFPIDWYQIHRLVIMLEPF